MMVEKAPFLASSKERWLFFSVALLLLVLRLGLEYREYLRLRSVPFYATRGTVERSFVHRRGGGRYALLRIRTKEGWRIYAPYDAKKPVTEARIRFRFVVPSALDFVGFMRGFFTRITVTKIEPTRRIAAALGKRIASAHPDARIASLYKALYLAAPLDPSLRRRISALGASHLVALSGFHLGILWALFFGLLLWPYRLLQQRFFPWRNRLWDLGAAVLALMGGYLWLTGVPPSLLRAYAMVCAGWLALVLGVELADWTLLSSVALLLTILSPRLLFSLGFGLSVAGVFYIYLLLKYFGRMNKWILGLLVLPWGIWLLMLPLVHAVFPTISTAQPLSPLLSLLFVPFYPISLLLHLVGLGALMDPWLDRLLDLAQPLRGALLSPSLAAAYLALSVASVRSSRAFAVLGVAACSVALWLYLPLCCPSS